MLAQTEQKARHLVIDIFVLTFERLEMRKHLVSQRALKERGKMWKWRDLCERSLCKDTCGTNMYKTSTEMYGQKCTQMKANLLRINSVAQLVREHLYRVLLRVLLHHLTRERVHVM